MNISKKQKAVFTSIQANRENGKDTFVFDGSIRTGKTKFGTWSMIHNTIVNANRSMYLSLKGSELEQFNSYAFVAWTYGNVERSIEPYIREYLEMWGMELLPNGKHGSKFKVVHPNGLSTTVYLYYAGADNKKSINKVQGMTLHGCFFDEAALLDENMIQGTIGRMVTYTDAVTVFCTNPEGGTEHWFYKRYIDTEANNIVRIHTTLMDNPIIPDGTIERYKSTFSDTEYQRKVLGQWVVSDGAVYQKLPKEIDKEDLPKFHYINIGVDEGRVDDYAGIPVAYGEDGRYYVFSEFSDTTSSLPGKVQGLKEFAEDIYNEYKVPVDIIGETNPGITVDILKDDITLNANIGVQHVKKSIKNEDWKGKSQIQERIDIVNYMINLDLLRFVKGSCPNLKSTMANAIYKNEVRLDDATTIIDYLDAFEYGLSTELKDIWDDIKDYLEKGKE